MGNGVQARPIGFIEVTPSGSRWVPAIDMGAIVTTAAVALTVIVVAICFRRRRR